MPTTDSDGCRPLIPTDADNLLRSALCVLKPSFTGTLDDGDHRRAAPLAAQFPLAVRHDRIPEPTLVDAILDRLMHNAHRV